MKGVPKHVEGLGKDYVPTTLHQSNIDHFTKVGDKESFEFARRMIKDEGIFCGASCGSVVAGCMNWIKENNLQDRKDLRFVLVLPDSTYNYITTFASDEWMAKEGFMDFESLCVSTNVFFGQQVDLSKLTPLKSFNHSDSIAEVKKSLPADYPHRVVSLTEEGLLAGLVSIHLLASKVKAGRLTLASPISAAKEKFAILPSNIDLSVVDRYIKSDGVVYLEDKSRERVYEINSSYFLNLL